MYYTRMFVYISIFFFIPTKSETQSEDRQLNAGGETERIRSKHSYKYYKNTIKYMAHTRKQRTRHARMKM